MERFSNLFFYYLLFLLLNSNAFGSTSVGKVLIIRGEALVSSPTNNTPAVQIKKDDNLQQGSTIQVGKNSFVKLIMSDNSQMTLGPETHMVLQQFPANNKDETIGVIGLLKGKLRASVAKDPLKLSAGDGKSKLFIQTKSAAMGVRGTEFIVTQNETSGASNCITLEGSVAMAPLTEDDPTSAMNIPELLTDDVSVRQAQTTIINNVNGVRQGPDPKDNQNSGATTIINNTSTQSETKKPSSNNPPSLVTKPTLDTNKLENLVSGPKSVNVVQGTVSAVTKNSNTATPPTLISTTQLDGLKNNSNFLPPSQNNIDAARNTPKLISIVPPGITPGKITAGQSGMQGALLTVVGPQILTNSFQEAIKKDMADKGINNIGGPPIGGSPFTTYQNAMAKIEGPPPVFMGMLPGGMIDLNNPGVYIPPPPNAIYDPNTKTFAPSPFIAGIDPNTGEVIHFKGFSISETGNFVFNPAEFNQGGPGNQMANLPPGMQMGPDGFPIGPNGIPMGPEGMPIGMGPGGMPMGMGPGGPLPGQYDPNLDPNNPFPDCPTCSSFPNPAENYCASHPEDTQTCGNGPGTTTPASTRILINITAP